MLNSSLFTLNIKNAIVNMGDAMQKDDIDLLLQTEELSLDEKILNSSIMISLAREKKDYSLASFYVEQGTTAIEEYGKVKTLEKKYEQLKH